VPTPQQTDSQPFTALLDAASSQQQIGAQANPSPPAAAAKTAIPPVNVVNSLQSVE
jgi:hypothetical protein